MRALDGAELDTVSGGQLTIQGASGTYGAEIIYPGMPPYVDPGVWAYHQGGGGGGGTVPCEELNEMYHQYNPDPTKDLGQFVWDSIRDGIMESGDSQAWSTWETFITTEYIACLEQEVYGSQ